MKKPLLIIQLRPEDDAMRNELAAFLKAMRLNTTDIVHLRGEKEGVAGVDLNDYSAILVGGSPNDISTPYQEQSDTQKMIEREFNEVLLPQVIEADFPFLGACSGNGLLGNHLGSKISKKYGEPISGVDIVLTDEGKQDPLLEGLPDTFRAMVGHKEACERLPESATLLATSERCPVQMFRIKNNIYATQFHPEADAEEIIFRLKIYANHGYFKPEEQDAVIAGIQNEVIVHPAKILKNFADRYVR